MRTLFLIIPGVVMFLQLLSWVLIADAILSWIMSPFHPLRRFLQRITGPLRAPFVPISNKLLGNRIPIDISGLLAMVAIQLLIRIISSLPYYLYSWFAR